CLPARCCRMFETLKKLKYGARVFLSRKGGEPETIDVNGRATTILHGGEGDGPPFVYLHSTLGESFRWFPFYQTWSKQFRDQVPELVFHDPDGYMAKMVITDAPSEETMLTAYQSMTVLARLVWERPYDPKLPLRLHRVKCPTLLLWGDDDKLVPPSYGKAYQ